MDLEVKIIPKNIKNLIANANIVLQTDYGKVTIKGFQIWRSSFIHDRFQERINITPPCAMKYGKIFPYVFFEDKQSWLLIEEEIYNKYNLSKKNGTEKKTVQIEETINPETIPI